MNNMTTTTRGRNGANARTASVVAMVGAVIVAVTFAMQGGTFARWYDVHDLTGAAFTSGSLAMERVGDTEWFDISPELGGPVPVDPNVRPLVPGDVYQATMMLDVAGTGTNLAPYVNATLNGSDVTFPGVDVTFRVSTADGVPLTGDVPAGDGAAVPVTPGAVLDGAGDVIVDVTFTHGGVDSTQPAVIDVGDFTITVQHGHEGDF